MYSSKPIALSLWDASKIFEYTTAQFTAICLALDKSYVPRTLIFQRQFIWYLLWEAEKFVFPFINICATSNASPCLPEYLNDVVKMLTEWQVGLLDDDGLFQKFWSSEFDMASDLMAHYRIVSSFKYCWWKDSQKHKGGSDPLLTNLRVLRDDLEQLESHLQNLLLKKTDEGRITLQAMAHLEGPVDDLQDLIAASQKLMDANMMEEEDD
ncbi:hypothetical protein EV702DRAFT_1270707 [Suillus placidus]|uniref:Uncharacterized protein n=1 Tax=Suillus placidus TaxID=48579 RepID=A0A9P6ZMW3_9AGAM|nr:hypothetical protein EV702DRAFT_1270707 [Suillus placidus]